jgi:ribonuclease BN (tRNA processing enzyme)
VDLLVLGSGSGTGTRFATSLALCGPDGLVLLDCGGPASSLLARYGEDVERLRAVLLSHWHVDHTADLPLLLQSLWLRNRQREAPLRLPIYGPPGTEERVRWLERFHLMRIPGGYVPPELAPAEAHDAPPGVRYQLGTAASVEFFVTTHFPEPAGAPDHLEANFGSPLCAYGMRLTCAGRTLVYSGDTGAGHTAGAAASWDLASHLDGCDLLIHEIGHQDADVVCRLAAAHRVPRLVLCHVPGRFDLPGGDAELQRAVEASGFRGEVVVATDGMRLPL